MENLTEDVIIKILISLPLTSIGRCRCVCKSWNKLLDHNFHSTKLNYDNKHENFRLLVTKRTITADYKFRYNVESISLISSEDAVKVMYPFEEKPHRGITFVGNCNGLICASHAGDIIYIWNPCTGEYKVVRPPFGFQDRSLGFGYDSRTRDYKFISVYCHTDRDVSQVEMYSLGSDTWKNYRLYNPYIISGDQGVFLNGAVHWLANFRGQWQTLFIIAMDMEDGEFKEIPKPKHMDYSEYSYVDVLRGCLCLLCSIRYTKFEIWEMKDYGVRESWSKVLEIDQQELMPTVTMGIGSCRYIRRAASLKDGEILLQIIVKDGGLKQYRTRVDVVKIQLDETKRRQIRREYIKAYMKRLRHQNRRAYIKAYVERLIHDCMTDNNLEISFEIINEEDEGCQSSRGLYEYTKNIQEMEAYVESLVSVNSGTFVSKEQKDYYRFEELPQLLFPEFTLSMTQE